MKGSVFVLVVLLSPQVLVAGASVSVPWEEFKMLYGESIERKAMASVAKPERRHDPQVHSIEEAVYSLDIGENRVRGEVVVSGRILSGSPEPIQLFGRDIVVSRTARVSGGSLLVGQGHDGGISFLPDGKKREFQVVLSFLALPREDSKFRSVSFSIPAALKNTLSVTLSDALSLLENPGIADADGRFHFSATKSLSVRFRDKKSVQASSLVEIDTFSRIRLQGRRAMLATVLASTRPWPKAFALHAGKGSHFVSSSLHSSWLTALPDGAYEIRIPPDSPGPFEIQIAVDELTGEGAYAFRLPTITGNNGREGDFVLEEPDDGRISLRGDGLVRDLPAARLGAAFGRAVGGNRSYMHMPEGQTVALAMERFRSIATPNIVLDTQRYFIAFEENGNVLSVLAMDIPAEVGRRLELKAVPDTEIWSLTVNGKRRKVYANDSGMWIIPLEVGKISHIELALLRKGDALGLHGRLEALLPATGLPSRTVEVGLALPERVQLLSLEGPLSPAARISVGVPAEFVGRPHFFARSFYKGQGMTFAVAYKEPVKQKKRQ
jgi:hypothetical protein